MLTPTGVVTIVKEGKQKIDVNGKTYLLETALHAKFALIDAFLADYLLDFTKAAFHPGEARTRARRVDSGSMLPQRYTLIETALV